MVWSIDVTPTVWDRISVTMEFQEVRCPVGRTARRYIGKAARRRVLAAASQATIAGTKMTLWSRKRPPGGPTQAPVLVPRVPPGIKTFVAPGHLLRFTGLIRGLCPAKRRRDGVAL